MISLVTKVEGDPVLQFELDGQSYRRFRHYYLKRKVIKGCGSSGFAQRYEYLLLPKGADDEEDKIDAFLADNLPAFLRDHPDLREE